jgi:hypothetical protein
MDLYFQGVACMNRGNTPDYLGQARRFFESALILDPDNIEALVGTAHVDAGMTTNFMTDDPASRFASAEAALTKALSVAPNNAARPICCWAEFKTLQTARLTALLSVSGHWRLIQIWRMLTHRSVSPS